MHRFLKLVYLLVILVMMVLSYSTQTALAEIPIKPANTPTNAPGKDLYNLQYNYNDQLAKSLPYNGVQASIQRLLCAPNLSNSQPASAGDLQTCINKLYRFGAAVGVFAAVFF